tara:strand:+ start:12613 stop:13455 length:843 start_codon:yes stop_codon:yes gene_type:complete
MEFHKYHGLGNDYLVYDPKNEDNPLKAKDIARICDRHYGLGSDGILVGPYPSNKADFFLKIYNPDGSEAEKSGNGLRIFSRYLFDNKIVTKDNFTVETLGGIAQCVVDHTSVPSQVSVSMGTVSFLSTDVPTTGPEREILGEPVDIEGVLHSIYAVSMGNPHCVVPINDPTPELTKTLGPLFEGHAMFPNKTNVQFLKILDKKNIQIEIWERGAGYTFASGSSSCAAAAVAKKMGICGDSVSVHMPGGVLQVEFDAAFQATLTGPVTYIGKLVLDKEALN